MLPVRLSFHEEELESQSLDFAKSTFYATQDKPGIKEEVKKTIKNLKRFSEEITL